MHLTKPIHPDFRYYLDMKDQRLIDLYVDLRGFILSVCPGSSELLYHTHALTSVYALSTKLSDAFCHIPIYKEHLNLGFNYGTLIDDPHGLLEGTGKLIRHFPVKEPEDYRKPEIKALLLAAQQFSRVDLDEGKEELGLIISKIKR